MNTRHNVQKEQAQQAASACSRLLTEQFQARRVILFGSLAGGQEAWHDQSDVDLAVEGLTPADYFPAYTACRALMPPGVELDLVPLEQAYPELRSRILGEQSLHEDSLLALQAIVEDELSALRRVAEEMQETLALCPNPPSRTTLRALASMLHEFYNGVERIFERIARSMGEDIPRGRSWHTDLLQQMACARSGVRAAVIDAPLSTQLKEYLDFRHFFRHAYGYTLQWEQLQPKAEKLPEVLTLLQQQLRTFFETQNV